jgi:cysteine desulfurase/selenocysteine lyase
MTTITRKDRQTEPQRLDVQRVRNDFPILQQRVHGRPLVYLDNAATAQKPQCVVDVIGEYYACDNANIHRGVHTLSVRATNSYEKARGKVQGFLRAARPEEIVFTRGATEAINLVACTYGRANLRKGDEILISAMEHHSNIVPWQILCQQTGAAPRVAPMNQAGEFLFEEYQKLLSPRTKIVAMTHVSNALGTIMPVRAIVEEAHRRGAVVLIDGAQAVPHLKVDVVDLDCDFYVFSGHKLYGPTGIGTLYAKYDLLKAMPPYQGGGDMIRSVTFEKTTYNEVPYRFEAGTPDIAGAIGLGAAIDYLEGIGMDKIAAYEAELLDYATEKVSAVPGLRILGTAREKASVISFVLEGVHPHDIGHILDQRGIAIRTGHHCAQPVMDFYGVPASARASLGMYNTRGEIDALVEGLREVTEIFR